MDAAGLVDLAENHWFDACEAMLRRRLLAGDTDPATKQAHQLASIGHRVISLDAEDFLELTLNAAQAAFLPLEDRDALEDFIRSEYARLGLVQL